MDFAQQQRNPGRHAIGIGIVVAMHVLVAWALVSGLARKVVEVVREPIQTRIIEEVKPTPPPPVTLPPPPRPAPPPPSFVPPPEVVLNPPPAPQPTITTSPVTPPPAPVTIAPPAAPEAPAAPPMAAVAPPAPAAPVTVPARVSFANDCDLPVYPRQARAEHAQGETHLRVSVGADGKVTGVQVLRSAGPSRAAKLLDRAIVETVESSCKFTPGTVDGKPQPSTADVIYVWKITD